MKTKYTFVFAVVYAALIIAMAACGDGASNEELGADAEKLIGAVATVIEQGDTTAFYDLLAPDVRAACTVEQVEAGVQDGNVLFPSLKVGDVYLNVNDDDQALVQLGLQEEPEGLEGLAATIAVLFPWPIVREGSEWRFGVPFGFESEGCPYGSSTETEEAFPSGPPPSAVGSDFGPEESGLSLVPPPEGAVQIGSGWGSGEGEQSSQVQLDSDLSVADLLDYYEQRFLQPDWIVVDRGAYGDLATVTWTLRDDRGHPWFGALVAADDGLGNKIVRTWMASGTVAGHFAPP